ncbi:acyltransferase [Cellulomonas sp. ES6]|uniref:acyltransferase family protein n=1 Tax=Cellulomonas sp. ES6 TaxID=3039384 RepID=UPI0024B86308|nr:acyltransferase [Cellulomonas sp. ES6]WHP18045.1 acyltransferase [Cellulomonas sp. ES6]
MRDAGGTDGITGTRRPMLDALRGVAIALVMLTHADSRTFGSAGMVGVTLFFTLSGYLITGLLLRDLERHGRIRYGRFFGARTLRLLPPLLLVLSGYLVVEGAVGLLGRRELLGQTVLAALTYTSNLPLLPHGSGTFFHLWTLATEEQFYLLWPLVLALAWRHRAARAVVLVGMLGSLAACAATIGYEWPDVARVYALPTSWSVALLAGCGLRLGRERVARLLPRTAGTRRGLGVALLAVLAALALLPGLSASAAMYLLVIPLTAAVSAALILLASGPTALPSGPARAPLRLLVALGTVSYAAYLWNLPIQQWLGDPRSPGAGLLGAALTLAAATVSWWAVERPAAALRRRWEARDPAPAGAAVPLRA